MRAQAPSGFAVYGERHSAARNIYKVGYDFQGEANARKLQVACLGEPARQISMSHPDHNRYKLPSKEASRMVQRPTLPQESHRHILAHIEARLSKEESRFSGETSCNQQNSPGQTLLTHKSGPGPTGHISVSVFRS